MKDEWIEKLRSRLENHEETPPQGLFADIQKKMSQQQKAPSVPEKRRKLSASWFWTIPAAAAVVAIGLFVIGESNNAVTLPAADGEKPVAAAGTTHNATLPAHTLTAQTDMPRKKRISRKPIPVSVQTESASEQTAPTRATCAEAAEEPVAVMSAPEVQNAEGKVQKAEKKMKKAPQNTASAGALTAYQAVGNAYSRKAGGMPTSVSAYCSGTTGNTDNARGIMLSSGKPFGTYPKDMEDSESPILTAAPQRLHSKARHKQPVKIGATAKFHLSNRWSVETGLEYSYLSSQFDFENGANTVSSEKQQLHYVGIPLKAGYSFVKTKRLTVYATAGGEMEKLVKGKTTTQYSGESSKPDMTQNISEKRPQFSVMAAAGAEYNVNKTVGIYAEPGISHHFNNGSEVENIYKKRPTNFSISLGVRFNLNNR